MARDATNGKPSSYAREKATTMRDRLAGMLGALLRRFIPIAFPGANADAMLFALLGFTAFSMTPTENTTEAVLTQSFHEVGLFQVPAGARSGPAPNNTGGNKAYWALATGAIVRAMLGRAASLVHNAWKPTGRPADAARDRLAMEDQTAVGLANLLRDETSIRTALDNAHRGVSGATNGWSLWRIFLMFTAMSRGAGQTLTVLRPYLAQLAAAPEAVRLQRLIELVNAGILAGDPHATNTWKDGVCYAIVRSLQKLNSGRLAAEAAGNSTASSFLAGARLAPDVETRITNVAYTQGAYNLARDAASAAASVSLNLATSTVAAAVDGGTGTMIAALVVLAVVGGVIVYGRLA